MSKGSTGERATVSYAEPPAWQTPYLKTGLERAENLYQSSAPQYYPGQTYVGFAPQTQAALGLAEQRATQGSPLTAPAQSEILKQIQGQYLTPTTNPYLQGLYNQMAGDVTAGVQSQFSQAGRYGSGANQAVLARELGNLANQVYAPAYQQERGMQQQALMAAPQLAQMDYADIERLRGVGGEREALSQAALQDSINRYQYAQQLPYQKLREYQAATGGSYGGTTTNVEPIYRNLGAGMLGGGLVGANIGSLLTPQGQTMSGMYPALGALGGLL